LDLGKNIPTRIYLRLIGEIVTVVGILLPWVSDASIPIKHRRETLLGISVLDGQVVLLLVAILVVVRYVQKSDDYTHLLSIVVGIGTLVFVSRRAAFAYGMGLLEPIPVSSGDPAIGLLITGLGGLLVFGAGLSGYLKRMADENVNTH
jgi:hypothetical protein